MIPYRWKFILTVCILVGLTSFLASCPPYATHSSPVAKLPLQQAEALQAINAAQDAINTAYTHVSAADAAGAQVADLISTLNDAIQTLNQARDHYIATNYGQAITLANDVETNAATVTNEAQTRTYTATLHVQIQALLTITIIVVTVVLLYFAITRWQRYRKQKKREFLQMRIQLPEADQEVPS